MNYHKSVGVGPHIQRYIMSIVRIDCRLQRNKVMNYNDGVLSKCKKYILMKAVNLYGRCVMIGIFLLLHSSCKKFVEINPPVNQQESLYVYSTDGTASNVLTGLFARMSEIDISFLTTVSLGLSSDELALHGAANSTYLSLYTNNANSTNVLLWAQYYELIYRCNSAIEGLMASKTLSDNVRNRLLGEARFIRAFNYFYLVNIFGDIPLLTTTDYKLNSQAGRTPKEQVFQQIVSDLEVAEDLLTDTYVDSDATTETSERVRPNRACASALLARIYLYTNEWTKAEQMATSVIENEKYKLLENIDEVFLKNSSEAIWQLMPVQQGFNTTQGQFFILPEAGPDAAFKQFYLSEFIAESFDASDERKKKWIDSVIVKISDIPEEYKTYYYPKKYKVEFSDVLSEYVMVLRLGEQYLIRAEARAQQGKITGPNSAESDMNTVRNRTGLQALVLTGLPQALDAITTERRHELFTEWGDRWLDLGRTQRLNEIMGTVAVEKGGHWEATDQLYPIPIADMQKAPNLKPQNPGY